MSSEIDPDFVTVLCDEYCLRVADGTHGSPKQTAVGKLLVTSKNVKDGRLLLDSAYLISEEDYVEINRRSKVDQWDLLLTMIGTVGEICIVEQASPLFAIKNVGLLKCGSELRAKWLYYFLRSPQGQQLIEQRKKGSTQQYISLTEIRNFPVSYPTNETDMRGAVSVLSALDDRITLLRETNATLEAIAQALFKSWFVDFDPVRVKAEGLEPQAMDAPTAALFPDSFEESELGLVPKGWRIGTVDDLCSQITNGGTPSRSKKEFWEGGSIPWFKTGEFCDGFLLEPSERITEAGVSCSSVKILPRDAVLMAIYAAPTVGRLGVLTEQSTFNQACTGMIAKDYVGPWFLFLTLFFGREWFNSRANGAAQQNISKAIVASYSVVIPSESVLSSFNEIASALFSKVRAGAEQAQTLTQLRDTLLPRLISGQLRLPEAEAQLEAGSA